MGAATQRKGVMMTLGMFTFPVNVETALEGTSAVSLNTLCTNEHGPAQVRQNLACPVCKNDDKTTFVKGKDKGAGRFAVIPDEKIEALKLGDSDKNNLAIATHPAADIARLLPGDKVYFLVPSSPSAGETYALVAALIDLRPDLIFLTRWAVRTAMAMYQLTTFEGRLCLKQVAWPTAVRALPEVPTVYDKDMLPLVSKLADAVCKPFQPTDYVDDRSKALLEYIEQAELLAGATVTTDADSPVAMPNMDLAEMLKASIAAAQAEQTAAGVTPLQTPRKRAPKKAVAAAS